MQYLIIFHAGDNASFDDFETLVKEPDEVRVLVRVSFLILRDDPPLNRYVKLIPLELFSQLSTINLHLFNYCCNPFNNLII